MSKKRKGKDDFPEKKRRRKKKSSISSDSESDEEEEIDQQILIDMIDQISGDKNLIFIAPNQLESEPDENKLDKYLKKLTKTKRNKLLKTEKRINNINSDPVPLRYKVLESDLNDKTKASLFQKVEHYEQLSPASGEYFKLKKYMDGILKIPFGKYVNLPVKKSDNKEQLSQFINNLKKDLDDCIFAQDGAKNTIMQIVAKWITNPKGTGNIIGLCGPPGVGKTSLIKNGLSKALKMPFTFIGLGGSTYAATLEGFDYTYEGSKWGRIVDIMIEHKCMNPIIFFDELDKLSDTKAGEELASILIHITDPTQNNSFSDKYFSGIDFDLSKSFLIFSFNDPNKIHPILRDRITIVNLDGFNPIQKISIAEKFSIDKICKNVGFDKNKIILSEDTIRTIISTYCPEKGVRKLEKCLEALIMKLNLFDITNDFTKLNLVDRETLISPYDIDSGTVIKLLDPIFRNDDMPASVRMMYS